MPNRGSRVSPALVGLISAVIMFGLLFFAFANVALFAASLDMKAQVASADTLASGADVEVSGVKVGMVKSIDKGNPGALIDMSVDTKKVTIYQDASLQIRPHGVFGPKFVQLDPGTASAGSFRDGDSISLAKTRVSVDFEQVLNSLDTNTRDSLQTLFVELGTASDQRGADFGQFLDDLSTIESQLAPVLQVIDNRAAVTSQLFESNATNTETFATSPLTQIIAKNADALAKLDSANPSIAGVIVHGNNVLTSLDSITGGSNTQALAISVSKLPALFDNLQKFNNALGYGVNALGPAITPQRGQTDSDIALAIKRARDVFAECDITDQSDPSVVRGGLADTQHATHSKIVPCYGADGKPTKDAAGHVAHHHVDVILGLHNHPLAPTPPFLPFSFLHDILAFPSYFPDALSGDNEGAVLCGPNSGNNTRPVNPAFLCLHTSQSDPIRGFGTAPPALFSGTSAASASASGTAGSPGPGFIPGLPNTSKGLDLLVALVLLGGGGAVGFGLWRARRA